MAEQSREALEYLVSLGSPDTEQLGLDVYSCNVNGTWTKVGSKPRPLFEKLEVQTLAAIGSLIGEAFEAVPKESLLIHVKDHTEVRLFQKVSDPLAQRQYVAISKMPPVGLLEFGKWYGQDAFVIGLLAGFAEGDKILAGVATVVNDRDYVIQLASRITNENIVVSEDDGISQKVTIQSNLNPAAPKEGEKLRGRVSLAPWRTFREIQQPASEFIFRARKGQQGPELALYEADGGAWKLDAMAELARFVRTISHDVQVIA